MLNNDSAFFRTSPACGVHEDRYIITAGGYGCHLNDLNSSIMYDTSTQIRVSLPDVPHKGAEQSIVLNGYIYTHHFGHIHRLCLSRSAQWEHVVEDQRDQATAMITNCKHVFIIYLYCDMTCFDPKEKKFVTLPRVPTIRYDFVAALVGNKIFVMGGCLDLDYVVSSSVEIFDIDTKTWSDGPCIPKGLCQASATVFKRWIIVNGGLTNEGSNDKTFILDTYTQTWIQSNHVQSIPRRLHRCVIVGSKLVCIGGIFEEDETSEYCPVEEIHIKHLIPDWKWRTIKDFLLLRQLIKEGRANAIIPSKRIKTESAIVTDAEKVVQKAFVEMNSDTFRAVLSFLI